MSEPIFCDKHSNNHPLWNKLCPECVSESLLDLAGSTWELLEICRWKCSPYDEVVLPYGVTNHDAMVQAEYSLDRVNEAQVSDRNRLRRIEAAARELAKEGELIGWNFIDPIRGSRARKSLLKFMTALEAKP